MGNHQDLNISEKPIKEFQAASDAKTDTSSPPASYISYVDPSMGPVTVKHALRHYIASALIYGSILVMFNICPWFRELLHVEVNGHLISSFYWLAYLLYLIISPFIIFIARPRSLWVSKNLMITGYLKRLFLYCFDRSKPHLTSSWRPTYHEKNAIAFLLIKIFYGPIMINSAVLSYFGIRDILKWTSSSLPLLYWFDTGYLLLVSGVFWVDSILFAFGYHSESGLLKNKLRFAETNPLHILVCVICYPPFNRVTVAFFGPSNYDPGILFMGDIENPVTWILRAVAVLFLLLLIASSLSLFTKASNLTNRGIVDWGPYRIVRHPGYLAKNLFWLTTLLPAFIPNTNHQQFTWPTYLLSCAMIIWGFVGWGSIYFLRAITEERFLMRDPDYVAYCKKVKYRFIPGIY